MSKVSERDREIIIMTIEFLEHLIVPSKDLGFIIFAIKYLNIALEEGGSND